MKWISVDILPELKQGYDETAESYYKEVCITVIGYDSVADLVSPVSYSHTSGFDNRNKDITHWMPLPEPPPKT